MVTFDGGGRALKTFLARLPEKDLVDVLIVPKSDAELEVALAGHNVGNRLQVFDRADQLEQYCFSIEDKLRFAGPRKIAVDFLQKLFAVSYIPDGIPGEFRLGALDWIGASEVKTDLVYLVRKDRISDSLLSRFVGAFRTMMPERRPKIVFDTEDEISEGSKVLATLRGMVQPFVPSETGIEPAVLPNEKIPSGRFLELFIARALSACAEIKIEQPSSHATSAEKHRYTMQLFQRIRALKECDRRFDAGDDIKVLQKFLRQEIVTGTGAEARWFAEAMVFTLLDRAYVFEEGPTPIEHALGISKQLNDDQLEAWASRFINLSAGVTPFAADRLEHAASRLKAHGRIIQSVYASTNFTITQLHRLNQPIDASRAEAVVDYLLDWAPYCERLSSVITAAGAAALISGNYARAAHLFEKAVQSNGGRLHQISAKINLAISKYVDGSRLPPDELYQIYREIIVSKMAKKLDVQHVYLFANLIALSEDKAFNDEVRATLLRERYMDYDDELVKSDKLFDFLASRFTMIADGHRFRGHRGDFVEKYGVLPLAQFIWS
jgi:hypothetical protein